MHVYRCINSKLVHIFQLQKSITIYFVYICCNFFYRCLLLQVENLNLATKFENYCFYAMLIACKSMSLCKTLDCDAKSEPPYLATNHNYVWGNHVVGFLKTLNPLVEMTFSIHKHNINCLKKFMCFDTYTKLTQILTCLKSWSKNIMCKKMYLDSLKKDAWVQRTT